MLGILVFHSCDEAVSYNNGKKNIFIAYRMGNWGFCIALGMVEMSLLYTKSIQTPFLLVQTP